MDALVPAPAAGGTSRWNLALKGLLLLLVLVLPGGSLILLALALWRGVKAARTESASGGEISIGTLRHATFRAWRELRTHSHEVPAARQHPGSIAA
ncbi:hypothetical protein [Vulgatibacter sp.]|uniref:hypothetical protein n=1 Tax=Vulgatibacter sp. TaxID=1971226 RepID=UPI003568F24B